MGRGKYHNKKSDTTLNDINNGVQLLVKSSDKKGEQIDSIKSNTDALVKNSNARLPIIIGIIGAVATVIGTIATIVGIIISNGTPPSEDPSSKSATPANTPAYEIYLYPDYKRLKVGAETDITASLNFDADSVNIDAYLNSVHNGDTVNLIQKNSSEWQTKVRFTEAGIFKVIATATATDGTIVEGSVEIEVISTSLTK